MNRSLPAGLSIDGATGLICGTIAGTAGGEDPYPVTVTASDGTHTTSAAFSWYVANNGIPMTSPGTQTSAEGDDVSLAIGTADPYGDSMAFSAGGLPDGLAIDPNTGVISGTISEGPWPAGASTR